MAKRYIIDLTQVEKEMLVELTRKGRPGARKVKRANILLLADQGRKDEEIVTLLHTSRNTVIRTRRKFVDGGLAFALNERSRAGRWPKIIVKAHAVKDSNPPYWFYNMVTRQTAKAFFAVSIYIGFRPVKDEWQREHWQGFCAEPK